jgi:hypothetical protein
VLLLRGIVSLYYSTTMGMVLLENEGLIIFFLDFSCFFVFLVDSSLAHEVMTYR